MTPDAAGALCSDTRILEEGEWFIALSGANYDGHDFLGAAFACGALGCIVEERPSYAVANQNFPLIAVTSTADAHHKLAFNWRRRVAPKTILICGAKEEVRQLIRSLEQALDERGKDVQSFFESGKEADALDFLLSVSVHTDAILFAMMPDEFDAIERLAMTVQPAVVVILRGAFENFRLLQSAVEIGRVKRKLFSSVSRSDGALITVGQPDNLLTDLKVQYTVENYSVQRPVDDELSASAMFAPVGEINMVPSSARPDHAETKWCAERVLRYFM